MDGVCGAGFEFQRFVPGPRRSVFGVDKEGSDANDLRSGGGSEQSILDERLLPAIEGVNFVRFVKYFDRRQTPVLRCHSSTLFSESSRARRGLFTTGLSRIF